MSSPVDKGFPWRSAGALFFFLAALVGFSTGVAVTERPEVAQAGILTHAYYSLSLFVVGGVDLGTPYGGTFIGRILVWIAYFGAPILAASTLISALLKALAPQSWALKRMKDHYIVVGGGELALAYLKALRSKHPKASIVVVNRELDPVRSEELSESFGALAVSGDITHEFFWRQLRVEQARRVMLLGDNAMRAYEAASILINLVPGIGPRTVIHCSNLRFMRAMANTRVARTCETFNTYQLAASGLVRSVMLDHFHETALRDVVIMAGFGRFGQTILEELQRSAQGELDTVAIIDIDAHRRVLVADEQVEFAGDYRRKLLEGDIGHPEVWDQLRKQVRIKDDSTVFVLGTGREEENLRTALWLRRKYPASMIISRSSQESTFANDVGSDHDILSISINQLVEDSLPTNWLS